MPRQIAGERSAVEGLGGKGVGDSAGGGAVIEVDAFELRLFGARRVGKLFCREKTYEFLAVFKFFVYIDFTVRRYGAQNEAFDVEVGRI